MYTDLRKKLEMYKNSPQNSIIEKKTSTPASNDILDGTVCSNDDGSYLVIENKYPLTYIHGSYNLGHILDLDISPVIKACNHTATPLKVSDLVFLDTETTGLSGGTGTVAFLIGIGFFEDNCFILRQYFMRDYDEEYPMLKAINNLLSSYKGLVTFNGKAFDWNLLLTRYIANRLKLMLKNPVQIDLLYPSRMLWKLKLESCKLKSLEENILAEYRIDDIPGSMIPGIYFKYLDDRNATEIEKVITHNEKDILSMVSLLIKINSILLNPSDKSCDGWELLGAGKIFEKFEDGASAISCYAKCTASENFLIKEISIRKLANIYKRNKDYAKAVEQLKLILSGSRTPNFPIMIELSKLYEHRIKDIPKALSIVYEAIEVCTKAGFIRNMYYSDLRKRLERLKRKSQQQTINAEL